MHKLLLTTGLLLALLVLDSGSEVLAQREGGAFWGAFSRGGSSGASMFPSSCAPGYVLRPGGCERLTSLKAKKKRRTPRSHPTPRRP
jgi:hypothetical protein